MQEVVSMFNNPTVDKLRDMKLKVMAQMLKDPDPSLRELTFEERPGIMVRKCVNMYKIDTTNEVYYRVSDVPNNCQNACRRTDQCL